MEYNKIIHQRFYGYGFIRFIEYFSSINKSNERIEFNNNLDLQRLVRHRL